MSHVSDAEFIFSRQDYRMQMNACVFFFLRPASESFEIKQMIDIGAINVSSSRYSVYTLLRYANSVRRLTDN